MINCYLKQFVINNIFILIFVEIETQGLTVWISDQAPRLWGLIWIQTVCIGHQRADKSAASVQRVNPFPANHDLTTYANSMDPDETPTNHTVWIQMRRRVTRRLI